MIKVIHTIAPEDDMLFKDIKSFETDSYIGIFDYQANEFVMMARDGLLLYLKRIKGYFDNLKELDDAVYEIVEQHINSVSDSSEYEFKIVE